LKYIIFSDIHLHTYSGEVDKESRLSKRLLIQKNILQQIIDLAIQEDAIILFGGDLVHAVGNVPVEVINIIHWFFEEIKKCGLKFYAVEGNHDQIIRKNCPTSHSILSPFQNREQRDKDLVWLKPTIRFIDYDQIDDVENIKGFDIVVVHAQPDLVNKHKHHMEGVNWKKVAKNNRYVFFGHDHTTRKLGAMAYVIGAPLQLTMNDVGEERGCWIVDSETWDVQFHKLDYPELKRLENVESKEETKFEERIKATSFQDILVEWLDKEQKPNTYLDLIQKDIEDKVQVAKNVFNGKIRSIYLKDFLSVGEIKIEYKNGFWLVLGANGTGKTSLTGEGIYWILFDENTKGLAKQEVVRDRPTKQKEAMGELELVDDKRFYTIRRSSKNGIEVISDNMNLVDGMTKVQAQEFLEKNILGFDKNTFLAACYFSQEQLLTLAQLGDADTTNLVTNLLGFETYDSLYVQMDLRKKEVTLQLELLEQSSVKLDNELWKNSEQQKNLNDQIVEANKMVTSLKEEQEKVNQQLDEFTTLLGNIVIPTVTTEEIDVSLLALNSSKTEMCAKLKLLQEKYNLIIQAQNNVEKEKIKIESERKAVEKNIANHEAIVSSLKENKCRYCGAILNGNDLEKHLGEEKAEISLLKASIQDNTLELDSQLGKLYDQEAENKEEITAINAEITKIECDIQELQIKKGQAIKELTEANSRKDSLTQQIKQLNCGKLSLSDRIQQINIDDKLTQLTNLKIAFDCLDAKQLEKNNDRLRLIERLNIYNFWAIAFSNKGIRPLLLDRFVNEFNQIVKPYCYKVSNGEFIVQFTPTTKLISGLERNKLGLEVVYKDKVENYAKFSGGEKTRVNLPLCLGLNKWVSQKYGITNGILGLIVLDEVFCWTDDKFRENVAQVLFEEGRTKSLFVIDHADTLVSYTNCLWLVSKENELTQLQVV
jgi:DNA repair exonuclease SbcCD ATPase subunit/DNA repair exonuclease SbcCD nuclease subunit